MSQHLTRSVLAGGVIYSAGTPATDDLLRKIPAQFWGGEPGTAQSPHSRSAKKKPQAAPAAKD